MAQQQPDPAQDTAIPVHITPAGILDRRVDAQTWARIKPYMQYLDEETIEEMDWFDTPAGWHVINEAAVEEILHVPPAWRVGFLRAQAREQRVRAQMQQEQQDRETRIRIQQKTAVYAAWMTTYLAGLEKFHDWFEGFPELTWVPVAQFDTEAGGWYDTGDGWSSAHWHDQIIYRQSYGNTQVYYTTRENSVRLARMGIAWRRKFHPTDLEIARHILLTHNRGCIGDSSARIVVEEDGIATYIAMASQEVWYIDNEVHASEGNREIVTRYNLPHVFLTNRKDIYDGSVPRPVYDAFKLRVQQVLGLPSEYHSYSRVFYLPEKDLWFVSQGHAGAEVQQVSSDFSDLFPAMKAPKGTQ